MFAKEKNPAECDHAASVLPGNGCDCLAIEFAVRVLALLTCALAAAFAAGWLGVGHAATPASARAVARAGIEIALGGMVVVLILGKMKQSRFVYPTSIMLMVVIGFICRMCV